MFNVTIQNHGNYKFTNGVVKRKISIRDNQAWKESAEQYLRGRIYTGAIGLSLMIPSLLLLGFGHSLTMIIGGGLCFGIGYGMFDANNMSILCQFILSRYRATAYGLMNMTGVFAGAMITNFLGRSTDAGNLPFRYFNGRQISGAHFPGCFKEFGKVADTVSAYFYLLISAILYIAYLLARFMARYLARMLSRPTYGIPH